MDQSWQPLAAIGAVLVLILCAVWVGIRGETMDDYYEEEYEDWNNE